MTKLLINNKNKTFYVQGDKDVHTNFGMVKGSDIKNAKPGDKIKSNKDEVFTVLEPGFLDKYFKIKRGAQIIPRKDIGLIITETGLGKDSVVIESGAGSGATGCFLANFVKEIYSYEIREDFFNIVKGNIEKLELKNMILKHKDAKLGFDEKADVIILDLPDPWELISVCKKSLNPGGYVVSYSPSIPQVMDFVDALDENFIYLKTSEIIEREWEISKRKVRPKSQAIGHSGFLSFARKI